MRFQFFSSLQALWTFCSWILLKFSCHFLLLHSILDYRRQHTHKNTNYCLYRQACQNTYTEKKTSSIIHYLTHTIMYNTQTSKQNSTFAESPLNILHLSSTVFVELSVPEWQNSWAMRVRLAWRLSTLVLVGSENLWSREQRHRHLQQWYITCKLIQPSEYHYHSLIVQWNPW